MGDIIITEDNGHGVEFKNFAAVTKCLTEIDGTTIDDAEDLDLVMPMYNLLRYSQNYSMTSGNSWNYCRGEIDYVDDNVSDGKSFKYKTNNMKQQK